MKKKEKRFKQQRSFERICFTRSKRPRPIYLPWMMSNCRPLPVLLSSRTISWPLNWSTNQSRPNSSCTRTTKWNHRSKPWREILRFIKRSKKSSLRDLTSARRWSKDWNSKWKTLKGKNKMSLIRRELLVELYQAKESANQHFKAQTKVVEEKMEKQTMIWSTSWNISSKRLKRNCLQPRESMRCCRMIIWSSKRKWTNPERSTRELPSCWLTSSMICWPPHQISYSLTKTCTWTLIRCKSSAV